MYLLWSGIQIGDLACFEFSNREGSLMKEIFKFFINY